MENNTKLIDKDALVAEINRRIIYAPINNTGHQRVWAYNDVKDILNSLEVKEVDFGKEIEEQCKKVHQLAVGKELRDFAKYFFELGLKAQKGE